VKTVSLADPSVADVQVPSPSTLLVVGKRAGTTSLYALDEEGRPLLSQSISVTYNMGELQSVLRARFPKVKVTAASAPGSLLLDGTVPDAQTSEAVARTALHYLGEKDQLINRLVIASPTQVMLRVRIAEVKRTVTQALGVNWSVLWSKASGGIGIVTSNTVASTTSFSNQILGNYAGNGWSFNTMIDLLDQEGLISVLAEPTLSAVSGQTASFLAGGEFPIPISQSLGTVSVSFKSFGVALDFTPTVLADDRISIKVRPEVSEIDPNNSVTLGGQGSTTSTLRIPGLQVRRMETTVEMGSGESFAIGGLLQNNIRDLVSQIPGLGRLPVLGPLFSSQDYQNDKSELVVIVTPYLVRPANAGALSTPLDSMRPSTDVEYILHRQIGLDPLMGKIPRLTGAAGFVY
jgi:pilus assembly protein CpaC